MSPKGQNNQISIILFILDLLEVCDPQRMQYAVSAEKELHNDDFFEEDFELMMGNSEKQEKQFEDSSDDEFHNFADETKNESIDSSDNEQLSEGDNSSIKSTDIEECSMKNDKSIH